MPEISRFLGIVIRMYFRDHDPAHFHVSYNENEALINIDNLVIIKGYLPPRIYGLVVEWAVLHKKELLENWSKAKNLQNLDKIEPLV